MALGDWNPETDPHTVRSAAYETVYWNGNKASGAQHATRGVVSTFWPGCGWQSFAEFELPAKRLEMESMCRSIARVYTMGKTARSAELLAMLGGKPSCS